MSTAEFAIVLAVVVFAAAAGVFVGYVIGHNQAAEKKHRAPDQAPAKAEPAEEATEEARPTVESNPPRMLIWEPQNDAPAPKCTCHGTTFRPGDRVLFWPIPDTDGNDSGAVDLFCQKMIEETRS